MEGTVFPALDSSGNTCHVTFAKSANNNIQFNIFASLRAWIYNDVRLICSQTIGSHLLDANCRRFRNGFD